MRIDLVAADLALAQTITNLGDRAVTAVGRNFATSAVNFSPLWANPEDSEGASLYYDGRVTTGLSSSIRKGVALHAQEVANLDHIFSAKDACLNAESIIGWRRYRRTRCYKEHWHEYGAERQFIMGIGSSACIKGLLIACRPEQAQPFNRNEKSELLKIRDAVSNAMVAFRANRDWTRDSEDWKHDSRNWAHDSDNLNRDGDDLLRALSDDVPIPRIVWNSRGHLVWLSHEAELRLEILSLRHGSTHYYTNGKQRLADLWTCASNDLVLPGWSLHSGKKLVAHWIAPNEKLMVRRFPRSDSDKPPYVLLCFALAQNIGGATR